MGIGLILSKADVPRGAVIHEIRSIDLVRDLKFPLIEDLVEHALGDGFVPDLLGGGFLSRCGQTLLRDQ